MKDIILLTKGELTKYFKLKIVLAGIVALIGIMTALSFSEYKDIKLYEEYTITNPEERTWQEREEELIEHAMVALEDPWFDEIEREQIIRRIEVAKYNLEYNIPRNVEKNMWWFFNDDTFEWMIRFIIVLTVFAGCINIGDEYSKNTLNQMLILPYKRSKILLSKYIAMLGFGLMLFSILFVLGIISGIVIHGVQGMTSLVVLNYSSQITTMSMTAYSLIIILLKLVELIFFISLTGTIAVLLRSGTVASVVGVLLTTVGVPLSLFFRSYYPIFNYLPLNNLDFRRYLDFGTIMPSVNSEFESIVVQGITPMISAFIVLGSIVVFIFISFKVFEKRDVA
ncbi:MAG: ABC transporter permease [Clostridium sp.]